MRASNRRGKYNARPTIVDKIWFASQAEARRYRELRLLERAGAIADLELQPTYALRVKDNRLGIYRGDFRYVARDIVGRQTIVEDVKGFDTPLSRWKRKHVLAQYGILVKVVK